MASVAWAGEQPAKIPITTTSDEARALYLQGRDLFEKLRATDSRQYAQQAVEKDANFALAYLLLAQSAPTATTFWEAERQAVATAGHASQGEQLMIAGFDAGARGDPGRQRQLYTQLVETYPGDERALTLLGSYYFGTQDYQTAIEHYERATVANPDYSPPYNSLGYAYRFLVRYDDARKAFERYIELIPNEPNPYDSLAELLMKIGKFEESIRNYEKALSFDQHFAASFIGIANNYMFTGKPDKARETLQKLYDQARTDDERREAVTWMAVSYLHQGDYDRAIAEVDRMQAIAKRTDDLPNISADLAFIGNIQLARGQADMALAKFTESLDVLQRADVPPDVKENASRNNLYNEARVALAKDDLGTAKEKTAAYGHQVEVLKAPFEIRQWHELRGLIALAEGDPATAVAELAQANQQDPRVLYNLALAYEREGKPTEAADYSTRAARFNQLNVNYAYVKAMAEEMLAHQVEK